MQIARAWVLLDKRGSNVPVRGVTPAELMLLVRDRMPFVGGCPVHNLEIVGESTRKDSVERQRLRVKYGSGLHDEKGKVINKDQTKVDTLYPGESSRFPQKFEELPEEILVQCKANKLTEPVADVPDWDDSELAKLEKELESETVTPVEQ